MTTNLTIDGVPRELLEQALLDARRVRFCTDNQVIELRALLDAPIPFPGYPPVPEDRKLPSAQPHGEPVAVMYADGSVLTNAECGIAFETCCKVETPLYAEQPALVAVVLPERKAARSHNSHDWDEGYSDGWKAYDDELKRLNPSL